MIPLKDTLEVMHGLVRHPKDNHPVSEVYSLLREV
jgi:hypothetical protein